MARSIECQQLIGEIDRFVIAVPTAIKHDVIDHTKQAVEDGMVILLDRMAGQANAGGRNDWMMNGELRDARMEYEKKRTLFDGQQLSFGGFTPQSAWRTRSGRQG